MSDVTVYHFWSPTCAPCKHIKPALEDLKEDNPDVNWVSVNTHEDTNGYCNTFNVRIVPTMVVVSKNGTQRYTGTQVIQYYNLIKRAKQ